MTKKQERNMPQVFGDEYTRCIVSSISSYELLNGGEINIYQKSGDTITLDFEVDYLAKIAFAKLDSYFKVDVPQPVACVVCSNKDKANPEEGNDRSFCDFCYKDKEHFAPPEEAKDE